MSGGGETMWWTHLSQKDGRRLLVTLSCLGAANAAEAVEVLSAGYILGGLDGAWRAGISSGVYCGMLLGGLLSGYVADKSRRRAASLQRAMIVAFAGASLAAFSPSPAMLLVCRVVAGAGVGAATPPLFALAAEVSPSAIRGACITYVAAWWMVGSIFAAGLAKIVLVSTTKLSVDFDLEPSRWRLYALACAAPALLAAVACALNVRDSPTPVETSLLGTPRSDPEPRRHTFFGRRKLAALGVAYWGLNFGYYGLATWISVVLARVGVKDVYGTALLYAAANVPGNIVAFAVVDAVGRKPLLAASMGLATLSALSLAFELESDPSLVFTVVAAMCFNASATAGWASLDALSAESFSALERATALGILTAVGRVASIAAQFVNGSLASRPPVLLTVTAFFMLGGTLSTVGLKELKNVDID
ncbi:hypothetical protein CTAYLR_009666 [Chrysophaeum taylorii]|uniref:Major facilitator superfamily (MFS) profile domain-containing protein n=1 Tax=Chrysophaeum taylorii TaxID=2483200 RepID=A0AAD7UKC4_9STRA|nr:hypothetical protein CTAYLR_009666 [Chrysophaeum taylorii]